MNSRLQDLIMPKTTEPSKPGWLEELSRKQAHRKSGLFSKEQSKDNLKENNATPAPPTGQQNPLPAESNKPQLPMKPSQIREDGEFNSG